MPQQLKKILCIVKKIKIFWTYTKKFVYKSSCTNDYIFVLSRTVLCLDRWFNVTLLYLEVTLLYTMKAREDQVESYLI
jgi:hypothetical protein